MPQPIVGIGDSQGACELVNLSLMHPRLQSTPVLIEPLIQPEAPPGPNAAGFATVRPDLWPSREVAEQKFRTSRMHSSWDAGVLDGYLKHGLRNVPTALYPASAPVSPLGSDSDNDQTPRSLVLRPRQFRATE